MYGDVMVTTYLTMYIICIIYLVVLGCYMLAQRGSVMNTHGEQEAKLRMTRTMAVAMFAWAFLLFIYIPPILLGYNMGDPICDVLFHVQLMVSTPVIYAVMFAIVQRKVNIVRWTFALGGVFFINTILSVIIPQYNETLLYISAAYSVTFLLFLLVRYVSEYRAYVQRIQSEYSEISGREIWWSWVSFFGFAIQGILFVWYQLMWSPAVEIIYSILSLFNATYLCYCICKQITIDLDVVSEEEEKEAAEVASDASTQKQLALYATIEEKLEKHCERQLLFLEPDLTREQLCRRLVISSTYLKMYFRNRGLSFYQYINTLRVEYAYKLMQDNPEMSISDVCEQAGFRSPTTFRKVFHEVMGCLPSEMKHGGPLGPLPTSPKGEE